MKAIAMTAMQQVIPGVDSGKSIRLTNGYGYLVDRMFGPKHFTNCLYPSIPAWSDGHRCIIRWKLSWLDRLRIAWGGNIWHETRTTMWSLQPTNLFSVCPIEPDGTVIKPPESPTDQRPKRL